MKFIKFDVSNLNKHLRGINFLKTGFINRKPISTVFIKIYLSHAIDWLSRVNNHYYGIETIVERFDKISVSI